MVAPTEQDASSQIGGSPASRLTRMGRYPTSSESLWVKQESEAEPKADDSRRQLYEKLREDGHCSFEDMKQKGLLPATPKYEQMPGWLMIPPRNTGGRLVRKVRCGMLERGSNSPEVYQRLMNLP